MKTKDTAGLALITGASAGIGLAIAQRLAGAGFRLILAARRREPLQALAAELPTECLALPLDVRDTASVTAAIAQLPAQWNAPDILVNNAGLALGLSPAQEGSLADWQTMVETNILGLLALTRAVLPGMLARGRGHIVNLSSIAGSYHYPGAGVYGASKAFVTYFSLALRADLLGAPVRVTNIEPGMVETDFSRVRFKGDEARAAAVYAGTTPLRAQDIAEAVSWAIAQPPHVNINRIEIMPTLQAPAGTAVSRRKPA